MPKNKKIVKVGDAKKIVRDSSKLRIGNRKNGTSAYAMSTQRLLDVLDDKTSNRYYDNAKTALATRGIMVMEGLGAVIKADLKMIDTNKAPV